MRLKTLTASLFLILSATTQAAQIYKWVDAAGVTHFDAQPPAGQKAQPVQINTPPPSTPPGEDEAPAAAPSSPSEQAKQRSADTKARQEAQAQQQQNDDYCDQARENLAQLTNNPRVRMEVDGEIRKLTETERQQQISTTRQGINEHCQD